MSEETVEDVAAAETLTPNPAIGPIAWAIIVPLALIVIVVLIKPIMSIVIVGSGVVTGALVIWIAVEGLIQVIHKLIFAVNAYRAYRK